MSAQNRRGFTLIGVVVVVLVLAVGFLFWKTFDIDRKGAKLADWAQKTPPDNDPTDDFAGGLTAYLTYISDHLEKHEKLTVAAGAHATGMAPDNHRDPPPPPVW